MRPTPMATAGSAPANWAPSAPAAPAPRVAVVTTVHWVSSREAPDLAGDTAGSAMPVPSGGAGAPDASSQGS